VEINLRDEYLKTPQNRSTIEAFEDEIEKIKPITYFIPFKEMGLRIQSVAKVQKFREEF